jgi:hypothetical protein
MEAIQISVISPSQSLKIGGGFPPFVKGGQEGLLNNGAVFVPDKNRGGGT